MPDIRRPASGPNNEPSLEDILRSDDLIDALSTGRPIPAHDDTDAMLAAMLGEWRDEMRWPPDTSILSEADAIAALNAGLAEKASSRRGRRGLSIVGSVAAAMLCVGGFGAVVAGSGPGDSLYGLRTMFFGAPKQVYDDQVVLTTKSELMQVQSMIAQGDWAQAQDKLVAMSSTVESISDQAQKQELVNQWNQLSARVVERNPAATVPPGVTFTVPPSLNELIPTAAPTTIPSMPPMTFSLPSEMSSLPSQVTSVRQGTGTFSPKPNEVSSAPGSAGDSPTEPTPGQPSQTGISTSPGMTTPGVSTTAQVPSTSAALTSQAATSAAPTSAAPTSAAPTSAAPTSAAPTSAAPTSAAPTSAGPTTASPNTSAPTTAAQSSAAQTSAAPSSTAPTSSAVTTTTPQPAAAPSSEPQAAPSTVAPSQATTAQQTRQQTQAIITTTPAAPAQSGAN